VCPEPCTDRRVEAGGHLRELADVAAQLPQIPQILRVTIAIGEKADDLAPGGRAPVPAAAGQLHVNARRRGCRLHVTATLPLLAKRSCSTPVSDRYRPLADAPSRPAELNHTVETRPDLPRSLTDIRLRK
jgi:hypothetical protein